MFLKNKNIIFKIRRSKVTDYAALKAHNSRGRFTLERIHNTKEHIYFYERVENHKAKEQMFK